MRETIDHGCGEEGERRERGDREERERGEVCMYVCVCLCLYLCMCMCMCLRGFRVKGFKIWNQGLGLWVLLMNSNKHYMKTNLVYGLGFVGLENLEEESHEL